MVENVYPSRRSTQLVYLLAIWLMTLFGPAHGHQIAKPITFFFWHCIAGVASKWEIAKDRSRGVQITITGCFFFFTQLSGLIGRIMWAFRVELKCHGGGAKNANWNSNCVQRFCNLESS